MDYFLKQKRQKNIIVILIILNLLTLILVFNPHLLHFHGPKFNGGPKNYIIDALQLQENQVEIYSEMVDQHREGMRKFNEQQQKLRDAYFSNIGQEPNEIAEKELLEIAQLEAEIQAFTYDHFAELRKILSEEQKQRFDSIIQNTLRNMPSDKKP